MCRTDSRMCRTDFRMCRTDFRMCMCRTDVRMWRFDLQRHEVWAVNGAWVREAKPTFGPGIAERYQAASQITQEQVGSSSTIIVAPVIQM